jgi:hypothetical protein
MKYTAEELEGMTKGELKAIILEHQSTEESGAECADDFKNKVIGFSKQLLINHGVSAPVAAIIATSAVTGLFNLFLLIPLLNK